MTIPEAEQLYAARLAVELDDLERAEAFLDTPHLRDILPASSAGEVRALIRDCRKDLSLQQDGVDWVAFGDARKRAARVRTELFSLVQTTLFREQGYDGALLDAADRLASHLQAHSLIRRPVVLALSPDAETMDPVVSMLRLKFPGTTAWHLPVLAHEYGHHAVSNLYSINEGAREVRPLYDVVEREAAVVSEVALAQAPNAQSAATSHARAAALRAARSQVNEYVADMFATFALGTAYPLTCIALRIDPGKAARQSDSHPVWFRRVEAMAATLEAISARTGQDQHAAMAAEVVRPLWARFAGHHADDQAAILRQLAESVVVELLRHTDGLLYDDADLAVALKDRLVAGDGAPRELEEAGVPTVLDAAWRWRRANWAADASELRRVNTTVLSWCRTAGKGLPVLSPAGSEEARR